MHTYLYRDHHRGESALAEGAEASFDIVEAGADRELVPICSTTAENVAARRAIAKAGFVSRHRILKVAF